MAIELHPGRRRDVQSRGTCFGGELHGCHTGSLHARRRGFDGAFNNQRDGRGQNLAIIRANALRQCQGAETHLSSETRHRRAAHCERRIGARDRFFQTDLGIEPAQARHAPRVAVAMIGGELRLHIESDVQPVWLSALDAKDNFACVSTGRRLARHIDTTPQRAYAALGYAGCFAEPPPQPILSTQVEATESVGGDDRSGARTQIAEIQRDVRHLGTRRPHGQLKCVELAAQRAPAVTFRRPGFHPTQRNRFRHAHRVLAVFGEDKVRAGGKTAQKRLHFLGARHGLHHIRLVEFGASLNVDHAGAGQARGIAMALEPFRVRGFLPRRVLNGIGVRQAVGFVRREIDVVFTGAVGFEDQLGLMTVHADPRDVTHAAQRAGFDNMQVLAGRIVAAAPAQAHRDSFGLRGYANTGAARSELWRPGTGAGLRLRFLTIVISRPRYCRRQRKEGTSGQAGVHGAPPLHRHVLAQVAQPHAEADLVVFAEIAVR